MKALLLTAYKKLELTEMPVPDFGPDDLLVRVKACGICGSDVHGFDGSTGRRIPPIVMGHEAAGVVESAGAAVTEFKPGDRITFDSTVYCGQCHFCRRGEINLCDNRRVLGVSCGDYRRHGAFAEFVTVPARICYKLPDSLSFELAAAIEPVSIAVHGVHRAQPLIGDSCVVVGAGMIGLLVVQVLRVAGAGKIIAIDLEDHKLALAKELGADETINAKDPQAAAKVLALTGGRGADVAIECVGASAPIATAISSVRKGGRISLIGNFNPKIELPLQLVVTRELTLYGSCASKGDYPACIDLLAKKKVRMDPIISAVSTLDQGPKWFERLHGGEAGLMKVILKP